MNDMNLLEDNKEVSCLPKYYRFIVPEEFCKQLFSPANVSDDYRIPSIWKISKDNQLKFVLPKNSKE